MHVCMCVLTRSLRGSLENHTLKVNAKLWAFLLTSQSYYFHDTKRCVLTLSLYWGPWVDFLWMSLFAKVNLIEKFPQEQNDEFLKKKKKLLWYNLTSISLFKMFIHDQAVNFKSVPFIIHLLRRMKVELDERQRSKEKTSYSGLSIHAS